MALYSSVSMALPWYSGMTPNAHMRYWRIFLIPISIFAHPKGNKRPRIDLSKKNCVAQWLSIGFNLGSNCAYCSKRSGWTQSGASR